LLPGQLFEFSLNFNFSLIGRASLEFVFTPSVNQILLVCHPAASRFRVFPSLTGSLQARLFCPPSTHQDSPLIVRFNNCFATALRRVRNRPRRPLIPFSGPTAKWNQIRRHMVPPDNDPDSTKGPLLPALLITVGLKLGPALSRNLSKEECHS